MPNLNGKTLLKRVLPIFIIVQRTADRRKDKAIKTFIKDLLDSYGKTSNNSADVGLKAYILTYGKEIFYESPMLTDCDKVNLEKAFAPVDIGGQTCIKCVMDRFNKIMSREGALVDFYYVPKVFWFADEVKGERDVYTKIKSIVDCNEFIAKSCRNVICSNWEKRIDFSCFASIDGDMVNAFPKSALKSNVKTRLADESSVDANMNESSSGFNSYETEMTDFINSHPFKTDSTGMSTLGFDEFKEYKRTGNDSVLTDNQS